MVSRHKGNVHKKDGSTKANKRHNNGVLHFQSRYMVKRPISVMLGEGPGEAHSTREAVAPQAAMGMVRIMQ